MKIEPRLTVSDKIKLWREFGGFTPGSLLDNLVLMVAEIDKRHRKSSEWNSCDWCGRGWPCSDIRLARRTVGVPEESDEDW